MKEGYGNHPTKSWTDRKEGKPFEKRESSFGGDKPARGGYRKRDEAGTDGGERKPYRRDEGSTGRAPYRGVRKEGYGDRPLKPWTDRKEGKPFEKRESSFGGDKPARGGYRKRDEAGTDGGERKPYRREEGSTGRAPYRAPKQETPFDTGDKPFAEKKEKRSFVRRDEKVGGDKPARATRVPTERIKPDESAEKSGTVRTHEKTVDKKATDRKPREERNSSEGDDRGDRKTHSVSRLLRGYRPGR
jgi:hypothetical protein